MHPYKVKFIESSFDPQIKHAGLYGRVDGYESALNLEAFLAEEYKLGYEMVSIIPVNANVAKKITYPNSVTIGYQVCLRKIKEQ